MYSFYTVVAILRLSRD